MMQWTHPLHSQRSPLDKSSGSSNGTQLGGMAEMTGDQTSMAPKWTPCSTGKDPQRDTEKVRTIRGGRVPSEVSVERRRGSNQARARARHLGSRPTTTRVLGRVENPASEVRQQRRVAKPTCLGTLMGKPFSWASVISVGYLAIPQVDALTLVATWPIIQIALNVELMGTKLKCAQLKRTQ